MQEVASLIQQALSSSEQESEIHNQIQDKLEEQIKTESEADMTESAKSKLGFLQKVVSLDCFFGSSDCLFKDKKSMEAGEVTEFAKKKIEQANHNDAANILAQVKSEVNALADKHKVSVSINLRKAYLPRFIWLGERLKLSHIFYHNYNKALAIIIFR